MSEIENGGPAFPTENGRQVGHDAYHFEGMTLRDYFAAKAMEALIVGSAVSKEDACNFDIVSGLAYSVADAMLAARSKA